MRKILRNAIILIGVLITLFSLCACIGQRDVATDAVNMGEYSIAQPEECTLEKQIDGTITLAVQGEIIGGIVNIPYANASQLDVTEGVPKVIWDYILSDDDTTPNYFFSDGLYNAYVLSFATAQSSEKHNLFPSEDGFYDIWYEEGSLSGEAEAALLESFDLH